MRLEEVTEERDGGDEINRTCGKIGCLGSTREREEECMKPTGWVGKAFTRDGDAGGEAGLEVGTEMMAPILDTKSWRCLWDNHMEKPIIKGA